jgi:guanine deaminase
MQQAFRASILHCLADPGEHASAAAVEYFEDGVMLLEDGVVADVGAAEHLLPRLSEDTVVEDFRGKLIVPGFIDCHVHYSQLEIIASYGEQLLDWLNRYAFPEEARFSDIDYAQDIASAFINETLRNGTTSALVFATVHPHSVDAILAAADAKNMRLIAGKVLMDRNCPADLSDTAESGYQESRRLIERWHGQNRLGYAITPRFALTSSEAQLEAAGELADEFPDTWVHTHLA